MHEDRAANWSRYWATGALHSCTGSIAGNYAGAIESFWAQAFARWKSDAAIVDLCCGNGPLMQLMMDHAPEQARWQVHGVDQASVAPHWVLDHPKKDRIHVQFHPATSIEQLPFADASVDAAVSQFGIEYADVPKAGRELQRVLKIGGHATFLMHHRKSRIANMARAELEHLHWLEHTVELPQTASALAKTMSRAATPEGLRDLKSDPEANRLRERFNADMAQLRYRAKSDPCPDVLLEFLHGVSHALHECPQTGSHLAFDRKMELWKAMQIDNASRLQDLLACAMDESQAQQLFESIGFRIDAMQSIDFDNGELCGLGLNLTRV